MVHFRCYVKDAQYDLLKKQQQDLKTEAQKLNEKVCEEDFQKEIYINQFNENRDSLQQNQDQILQDQSNKKQSEEESEEDSSESSESSQEIAQDSYDVAAQEDTNK